MHFTQRMTWYTHIGNIQIIADNIAFIYILYNITHRQHLLFQIREAHCVQSNLKSWMMATFSTVLIDYYCLAQYGSVAQRSIHWLICVFAIWLQFTFDRWIYVCTKMKLPHEGAMTSHVAQRPHDHCPEDREIRYELCFFFLFCVEIL